MSHDHKTRNQLLEEVSALRRRVAELESVEMDQCAQSAEERTQLVLQRVRQEVWKMKRADDIETMLEAVGEGLRTLEVPFLFCGINVVDASGESPSVTAYSMRRQGPSERRWQAMGGGLITQFWRGGELVYRPDLASEDPYEETAGLPAMRAVVDVPFSHGTLAVSSPDPEVFTQRDLDILRHMAAVLSDGFRRLEDLQALERRNRELEQEITERRLVQEQLQESLTALEQTHAQLHRAQDQLVQSEKMAALGDLVAGIAHELNTPVGAINSMYDTLHRAIEKLKRALAAGFPQEYADDRTSQAALKAITDASRVLGAGSERVSEIVGSLRNFVRLDEGEYQVADLHEGLESTLTLLQSQLTGNITVVREYGDLKPIYCAPGQLNQVFMHLMKNAIQSVDGAGEIRISTRREDRKVYIQICDTGAGIPAAQLENLFDIGFNIQGGQVKMAFGWSAAYAIIRNHGGELKVASEAGKCTEVTISMPARTSERE